jgi:ABC-2 type transport system permease protein
MNTLADTWRLLGRHQRATLRAPIWSLINLVYPVVWLLLFGQLFGGMADLPGFPEGGYQRFLTPGVVVMTVIYGASFAALGLVMDFRMGVIDRYLTTPASRPAIIFARVLDATVNVTVQAIVVLLIAFAIGVRTSNGIGGALLVVLAAALLAVVFAAFSTWLGIRTREQQGLVGMMNVLIVPLIFLSTALLPVNLVPGWIAHVMPYNPVSWAVNVARAGTLDGTHGAEVLRDLGGLVLLALVFLALAFSALRSWERSR